MDFSTTSEFNKVLSETEDRDLLINWGRKKGLKWMLKDYRNLVFDLDLLKIYWELYIEYRETDDKFSPSYPFRKSPEEEFFRQMIYHVCQQNWDRIDELKSMYDFLFNLIGIDKSEIGFVEWGKKHKFPIQYANGYSITKVLFLIGYICWTDEDAINRLTEYADGNLYLLRLIEAYLFTQNGTEYSTEISTLFLTPIRDKLDPDTPGYKLLSSHL